MKIYQRISIIMGAMGVSIGAFGAHALHDIIETQGREGTWDTGMLYYWIHCIALFSLTFSGNISIRSVIKPVCFLWVISTFIFAGSLFALSLGAPGIIGAITPIGGVGFIIGWLLLLKVTFTGK